MSEVRERRAELSEEKNTASRCLSLSFPPGPFWWLYQNCSGDGGWWPGDWREGDREGRGPGWFLRKECLRLDLPVLGPVGSSVPPLTLAV